MKDINLRSVNWQDGMLLQGQHLLAQERFMEELARAYGRPTGDNYGLVRSGQDSPPALQLSAAVRGSQIQVTLERCHAVTPDGYLIELNPATRRPLQVTIPAQEGEIPVYVAVHPDEKVAGGEPDPHEEPPRQPYRLPEYLLYAGEQPDLPGGCTLQVGLFSYDGVEIAPVDDFFPPCVSLYADERLYRRAVEMRQRLETLLSVGSKSYAAVTGGGVTGQDGSSLQADLKSLVYGFLTFLGGVIDSFQPGPGAGHPRTLVILHKQLLRTFRILIDLHPSARDYLHEQYFVKQAGMDIAQFQATVDEILLAPYNHEEIGGYLRRLDAMTEHLKGILTYLAGLSKEQLGPQALPTESLAYGGRTYQMVPYGHTEMEQVGELVYLQVRLEASRQINDTVVLLAKNLFSSRDWHNVQVRLGINDARGLGETDPMEVDVTTFGDKVAMRPHDMVAAPDVSRMTLIFRGIRDARTFSRLGRADLAVYAM